MTKLHSRSSILSAGSHWIFAPRSVCHPYSWAELTKQQLLISFPTDWNAPTGSRRGSLSGHCRQVNTTPMRLRAIDVQTVWSIFVNQFNACYLMKICTSYGTIFVHSHTIILHKRFSNFFFFFKKKGVIVFSSCVHMHLTYGIMVYEFRAFADMPVVD